MKGSPVRFRASALPGSTCKEAPSGSVERSCQDGGREGPGYTRGTADSEDPRLARRIRLALAGQVGGFTRADDGLAFAQENAGSKPARGTSPRPLQLGLSVGAGEVRRGRPAVALGDVARVPDQSHPLDGPGTARRIGRPRLVVTCASARGVADPERVFPLATGLSSRARGGVSGRRGARRRGSGPV
jgi:hypothetical protein